MSGGHPRITEHSKNKVPMVGLSTWETFISMKSIIINFRISLPETGTAHAGGKES